MQKLQTFIDLILKPSKQKKIAIFDLDGTLFDVTPRTMEIVRQFSANSEHQAAFTEHHVVLKGLQREDYAYSLEKTLLQKGIDHQHPSNEAFFKQLLRFWRKHFFSDPYLQYDHAYPGAVDFVNALHALDIEIIYLSGRSDHNMKLGTIESLRHHGFPISCEQYSFYLKPRHIEDDLEFKVSSFAEIAKQGEIVFSIDNEPRNVNAFANHFHNALHIHFNTLHAYPEDFHLPNILQVDRFEQLMKLLFHK